jgi:hypothetical protein
VARKHNCKHDRSPSRYKQRLADRGLGKTPRMKWTGLSTLQIQQAWANLPRYKWSTHVGEGGQPYQMRHLISS